MAEAELPQELKEMIDMAKQGTARSHQLLAENVLDLFISPQGRMSDRERALTDSILSQLVGEMEQQIRQGLAERLSKATDAPPRLLEMLANDEISIARPILQHSKLLQDTALIEIVRARGREHQLAIALRAAVSVELSDALVERGDTDVIESLIRNPNAALSNKAMTYLVAESRRFDRFQEPLLSRADLPPALAHKMFWWVSAALRQKILIEYELHPHVLDPLLETTTEVAIADTSRSAAGNRQQTAAELAEELRLSGQLSPENLLNMLRKQRIQAFTAAMASLSNISFTAASRIILDHDVEPFAVLCRAIQVSEAHFSSMALLLLHAHTGKRQSINDLREVLELFHKISYGQARITLQYWHNDSALQRAAGELG